MCATSSVQRGVYQSHSSNQLYVYIGGEGSLEEERKTCMY